MNLNNIKSVHIIGIGGCASSAIAEFLTNNGVQVTGSEMKKRDGLDYLEKKGVIIKYRHDKKNLYINENFPDMVLYSPAVISLNPDNPELKEAESKNIEHMQWQKFIGTFLNKMGKTGITVSGSEGKGTTAGILTMIIKGTEYDPLSILGAKVKNINGSSNSNIYIGNGKTYILEGDEYNRNFHNYNPAVNVTVNFKYEHPETYKNFDEYKQSFAYFFKNMTGEKKLIFKVSENTTALVKEYKLDKTHKIIWFSDENNRSMIKQCDYIIKNKNVNKEGISFNLEANDKDIPFNLRMLPGYMIYNSAGAVIAAMELGLPVEIIRENIKRFNGMVRRFDVFKTQNKGIVITDYGHSPEAVNHIINEIRSIFNDKKIHIIFQPHLFSRTFNFFKEFVNELSMADKVSLIDIYPAREKQEDWESKISSKMLYDELRKNNKNVFYTGKVSDIYNKLINQINENETTVFLGAGDMDLYYSAILNELGVKDYFE